MQQNNQPPKFVIPFAQNDPAKAVIPVTSPDDTRASQALGFPPRTGLPPEAGGVPPQKADINGALNQLAGPILWALAGGRFPFDNAFAADTNVGGYPLGADLLAADARGSWVSTANDNTANPDTVGTGWVPGYHYGATALAGQAGGNVTLSPAQAAKRVITVAGTLTSNLVLIVPAWVYGWTFYNNTSGAFSVSVRTATGSAAAIPQNGAPTPVNCDGTNCSLLAANVAAATSGTQAARLDQVGGRLLGVQRITASGTYTPTAGTNRIVVELVGGGGGGGAAGATGVATNSAGSGGGAGAYARILVNAPTATAVTIGPGGVGGGAVSPNADPGGATAFGGLATVSGGSGGLAGTQANQTATSAFFTAPGPGGVTVTVNAGATLLQSSQGQPGTGGISLSGGAFIRGGDGGSSMLGSNAHTGNTTVASSAPSNSGAGGAGTTNVQNQAVLPGGNGGSGLVIVWEYA